MSTIFTALPDTARHKAAQAIAEAFPGAEVQSLAPLHGGLSGSLAYKLVVDGRPLVLRIVEGAGPLNTLAQQFTCMRLAAEHSIAPQVHYANLELGVSISSYVEHRPELMALQRDAGQVAHAGDLLRRLHGGPVFPASLDPFQMIQGGIEHLVQAGVTQPGLIEKLLAEFEAVKPALEPHLTSAPCHNDLNPGNMLYDGERLWLIDWEGAGMGDPMFDLAGLIHWFVLDTSQEARLLKAYFQRDPTERERAKLALMKQVSWCFYAVVFLLISIQDGGPQAIETIECEQLPSFAEAIRAITRGEIRLENTGTRRWMSLVIAKQSLGEIRRPEFSQVLTRLGAV